MNALRTILGLLLSDHNRVPLDEREDDLCMVLHSNLPELDESEIQTLRALVASCMTAPLPLIESALLLIDGHLALRSIFASTDNDFPIRRHSPFGL